MNKRNVFGCLLFFSLVFNGLVFWLDVVPTVYPKVKLRYFPPSTLALQDLGARAVEDKVYLSAKRMLYNKKPLTVWQEHAGFMQSIINMRHITARKEFQIDNYPRAFLYKGVFDYAARYRNSDLKELRNHFDNEILSVNYSIKRIDQVPLGLVSLNLYRSTGNEKYLLFSIEMYKYVKSLLDSSGMLSYRTGQAVMLSDALGLVGPFLVEYGQLVDEDGINIFRDQLEFYIKHGLSGNMPSHGINKSTLTPVGSSNWGRGIGWYLLGLSSFYDATGEFEYHYYNLLKDLEKLKLDGALWGQFPGSKSIFDASASLLFIYADIMNNPASYEKSHLIYQLSNFISDNGDILGTSGDTIGANYYSRAFGKSELSQGLFLSILSKM